jgi:magnesium-protoporphyrin IX monomethyl ester (oxidative) cyclase
MKVLLINPPWTSYKTTIDFFSIDEPLGLGYLGAYLRKFGFDVQIFDAFALGANPSHFERMGDYYMYGLSMRDIKATVKNVKPDLVGISSMYTLHSKGVHETAKAVKEVFPDVPVVVGGSHASVLTDWILKDTHIDVVAMGEGEETLLDIAKHVESGRRLRNIKGTALRGKEKIIINKPRPFIENLDTIPFPARDLMPMTLYLNDWYRTKMSMRPPRANMVTSRGCFGQCVFCSIHNIWKHTWRGRSAENVLEEIELLKKDYGVNEIAFQDDNVSMNPERMEAICDGLIDRKLNIKWCTPNGIAIWTLNEKLIDKMKKSGCYKLTFGIETGCPETQKFIRKSQINLQRAQEIIKYCNRKGIWTHSAFIIGFPYETREQINQTIDFAVKSDLDMATFWISTPYPGTDLYGIYDKEKLLPPKEKMFEWMAAVDTASCNTKHLTATQIQQIRNEAHTRFYNSRIRKFMNPLRILRKAHTPEEIRYGLKLAGVSTTLLTELKK